MFQEDSQNPSKIFYFFNKFTYFLIFYGTNMNIPITLGKVIMTIKVILL